MRHNYRVEHGHEISLLAVSLLLAGISGFVLSRSVPGWQIDYENENALNNMIEGSLVDPAFDATVPRPWDPFYAFFNGAWGAALLFFGGVAIGIYGWGEEDVFTLERFYKYFGLDLFITKGFLFALPCLLVGYVLGRLGDKGPVGPLE